MQPSCRPTEARQGFRLSHIQVQGNMGYFDSLYTQETGHTYDNEPIQITGYEVLNIAK